MKDIKSQIELRAMPRMQVRLAQLSAEVYARIEDEVTFPIRESIYLFHLRMNVGLI